MDVSAEYFLKWMTVIVITSVIAWIYAIKDEEGGNVSVRQYAGEMIYVFPIAAIIVYVIISIFWRI